MYVLETCVCVCVTNARPDFTGFQKSEGCDGRLLRFGAVPIVVLTSGPGPPLAVSTDSLQHTGDI